MKGIGKYKMLQDVLWQNMVETQVLCRFWIFRSFLSLTYYPLKNELGNFVKLKTLNRQQVKHRCDSGMIVKMLSVITKIYIFIKVGEQENRIKTLSKELE